MVHLADVAVESSIYHLLMHVIIKLFLKSSYSIINFFTKYWAGTGEKVLIFITKKRAYYHVYCMECSLCNRATNCVR